MARETAGDKLIRMTEHERVLWAQGLSVAGIDEVGRGPLAGPVTSACIVVPENMMPLGVDDSKKLSEKKRELLYEQLMGAASYVRVASVPPDEIDQINILNATKKTMQQAAEGAIGAHFLIDAVEGLTLPGASTSLIHGDAISYMIAAASIIAKVTRDRYMAELHARYPMYNFLRNKGYGTSEHICALREYGPCAAHRLSFIGKIMAGTNR
ncbi:ribonuclease HII [Eubacteriales bacterium OttesenSCG-928-N13]|nr:ribonuclease HII [Eubacteriales bacterium OttesenSCG-928-N13]